MAPTYILTGRGGAGNKHISSSSSSSSTSSSQSTPRRTPSTTTATTQRYISNGVGGAGNIRTLSTTASQAAITRAVKDDITRAAARDRAPIGYAGRGGAGNAYSYAHEHDDDAASDRSGSSVGSKARLWLSETLSRD